MMRQRREISKDEEEITVKRSEGGKLRVDKVLSAPELVVARTQMRKWEAGKGKDNKMAGWSSMMFEKTANRQECEDSAVEKYHSRGY